MLKYTFFLIRRGDEVLLLNRVKAPWMGRWIGVGGHIEPGETPLEGALREAWEETGIRLETARYAGTVTWFVEAENRTGGMHAFVADIPESFEYAAPRATREGVLDWKPVGWVLDPANLGLADHFARFAPTMLAETGAYDHHFTWHRTGGFAYERRELAGSGL